MKGKGAKIKVTAIVPSAGKGARFKSGKRKPFAQLYRQPVLSYALKILQSSPLIEDIVLVIDKPFFKAAEKIVERYGITKVRRIVEGGRTRSDSVREGLRCVDKDASFVLIHDGVRPFVSKEIIKKAITAAARFGASVSAVPVKATIKVAGKGDLVKYTPDRGKLWEVQTPQVFKRILIEKAYKEAYKRRRQGRLFTPLDSKHLTGFTDDAALVENIGRRVKIVKGDYRNIKITTAEDINVAEAFLRKG